MIETDMFNVNRWIIYAFSVVLIVGSAVAQRQVDGSMPGPGFVILIPAITLVAFLAGTPAAAAAAVLGVLLTLHEPLRAPPLGPLRADDILRAALFAMTAGVDILVVHSLNAALVETRALYETTFVTLQRQQTLFQELQHRVANNIQFVASVLTLHRNRLSKEATNAIDALDAARDRLANVARVHRRLSDPQSFATPRLYIEELCSDLVAGFPVAVVCTVDPGLPPLPASRLVTMSLIITEAVTNALKHAFPGGMLGTIKVELTRDGPAAASLVIRDNGKGLPAGFDPRLSGSLGMRILEGLAQQLDGTLHFEGGEGTTIRVTFQL